MSCIIELKTKKDTFIVQSSNLTIIDCYADWCNPCKKFAEFYANFANENNKYGINYCKLNVENEEFEEFTNLNNVTSLPTILFFKNGKTLHSHVGFNMKQFKELVEKHK